MKRSTALAAMVGAALVISPVNPSRAEQQNRFQLAFCNISALTDVMVALIHKRDAQTWTVEGWYPIPDNSCTLLGSFMRDTVYWYGEGINKNRQRTWWVPAETDKNASSQCIDRDKTFRASTGSPACPTGQVLAKFLMLTIPPDLPRLTFTLK